jgi:ABC-type antimicrobial peptide transport system permease subunit
VRQYKDILYQMDTDASARVLAELRTFLGSNEQEPIPLLQQFLAMDDGNFQERYDFFYRVIAPTIILYQVRIGDTLTIQSFTRRGYPTQVVVKVYGTYRFTGLEKSALAGLYNLMDLMTFRDLFGASTEESRIENEALKKKGGVADVKKEDAEAALFSDDSEPQEEEGSSALLDEYAGVDMKAGGRRFTQDLFDKVYTREEIDTGVTPNAAIVLDAGADERKAAEGISAAIAAENLGLKMVDWKKASGLVGQFIDVIWIVLVVAILIIFLVALVIINNSMLMATLDRTREIGTMRAIGAGRSYVLKMFLIESSVLGLGFGILGLLLGSGIVALLNALGIPAVTDELYFLFAGPRLRPVLLPSHLAVAFVVVFIVSVLSTLYPARIATRVAPVKAMGKED